MVTVGFRFPERRSTQLSLACLQNVCSSQKAGLPQQPAGCPTAAQHSPREGNQAQPSFCLDNLGPKNGVQSRSPNPVLGKLLGFASLLSPRVSHLPCLQHLNQQPFFPCCFLVILPYLHNSSKIKHALFIFCSTHSITYELLQAAKKKIMSKITYVEILDMAFYFFILTRNELKIKLQ